MKQQWLTRLIYLVFFLSACVHAQPYPTKPIRVITLGGPDIVPRILGQKIAPNLGQNFLIEERAGAGGTIGGEFVARSAPDGHTLVLATATMLIGPSVFKISYDTARDLAPITLVATTPWIIAVHPSLPPKTLAELVRFAKARPGQINFSATTPGSAGHLTMELFKITSGINVVHVAYKNLPAALTDTVGGQVQMTINVAPLVVPQMQVGRLRGLAVSTLKRSAAAPDLPTIAESGYPGFDSPGWYGFMAPANTPAAIIATLNRELVGALRLPDVRERFVGLGLDAVGDSPQEFGTFVRAELDKWARLVKVANIQVDTR